MDQTFKWMDLTDKHTNTHTCKHTYGYLKHLSFSVLCKKVGQNATFTRGTF